MGIKKLSTKFQHGSAVILRVWAFLFLNLISIIYLPQISQATVKYNFSSIKLFATYYGNIPVSDAAWAQSHVDLGVPNQEQLNTSLYYVSWSDMYMHGPDPNRVFYPNLYNQYDSQALDFNDAFLHYSKNVNIPLNSPDPLTGSTRKNSLEEDRFVSILNCSGSPLWSSGVNAKWGNSLTFNGDGSSVNLGTAINSQITDGVTFEAWIKPQSQVQTTTDLIFGWSNGFTNGIWIDTLGRLAGEIIVNNQREVSTRYTFPIYNAWYHVVVTGSAATSTIDLYVNGVLIGKAAYTPGSSITNIASTPLLMGEGYQGAIDDVRIYNRALTAAEVQARYTSNTNISNGLIGYWNLDEGQGVTVNDASGNGTQGTFQYPDITDVAYGDYYTKNPLPQDNYIPFSSQANAALYLGDPWKFNEINFNLSQTASSDWSAVWEYWNGSAWTALAVNDGTNNMGQNGKVTFVPPDDWSKFTLIGNYVDHLFWVRLRVINPGTKGPIFYSTETSTSQYNWVGASGIYGWQYPITQVAGVSYYVVPGWDPANDRNGNGYVDDSEFANLTNPLATARLKYQSLVPSLYLSLNRFVTNLADPVFKSYITNLTAAQKTANGLDGVFLDNAQVVLPDNALGNASYLEYTNPNTQYLQDTIASIAAIKAQLGTSILIPNTNSTPFTTPSIITNSGADGFFAECMITFDSSLKDTPANLSLQASIINAFNQANKMPILQVDYDLIHLDNPQLKALAPSDYLNRLGLYGLAKYYLIKSDSPNDQTYFSLENPTNYNNPQLTWINAIANDMGTPIGDYYILQTVKEGYPTPPPTNLVNDPSFESESTILNSSATSDWFCSLWSGPRVSTCNINNTNVEDGAHSLEIDGSSTSKIVGAQWAYQNLLPNTTYTISGWIKTNGITGYSGSSATICVNGVNAVVPGSNYANVSNGTQDWTYVYAVFTTGSSVSSAVVDLINNGTAGSAWFDNVRLEQGSYHVANIFARQYTKGMVLLKPMSIGATASSSVGDDTMTTLNLGNNYQPLNADGTLGSVTNSVSMDDFQGMILVNTNNAANFNALDLIVSGAGSGSVSSSPSGVNCSNSCNTSFNSTATVTLTAVAKSGSVFSGWLGACNGTGVCNVPMNAAQNVTAEFEIPYTLSASTTGTGFGGIVGNGINCDVNTGVCSETLNSGTPFSLSAVANNGSVFTGWSGACSGSGNCTLTMSSNTNVSANFSPEISTYTITAAAGVNGTIYPNLVSIPYSGTQVFNLVPGIGYTASLKVDGFVVNLDKNTYTLSNVKANHSLVASFSKGSLKSISFNTRRND